MPDFSIGEKFKFRSTPGKVTSKIIPITLHEHHAEKAGLHYDLRLAGKGDWAIRYFPESPGEKRLAIKQPTHPLGYYDFEGEIKSGYGKGKVNLKYKGQGELFSWSKDKISFSFNRKSYVLIRTSGDKWIIMMRNPMKKLSFHVVGEGDRLTKALVFDSFSNALKDIGCKGNAPKTKGSGNPATQEVKGTMTRAQNPNDHDDIDVDKGPRSRAMKDMALGNTGF